MIWVLIEARKEKLFRGGFVVFFIVFNILKLQRYVWVKIQLLEYHFEYHIMYGEALNFWRSLSPSTEENTIDEELEEYSNILGMGKRHSHLNSPIFIVNCNIAI